MRSTTTSVCHSAHQPIDGDAVAYFRFLFGTVGLFWAFKQFSTQSIEYLYILPRYHFHYYGFEWVELFGSTATKWELLILGLAAAGIALGLCYRIAAFTFATVFSHLFLADKCLYQNHYYLICLVAWIMVIIPANRVASLDACLLPKNLVTVPRWSLWLLRFQIGVPYFFGAIAKINGDWLAGEPMRSMLAQRTDTPFVGQFFTQVWCVFFFAAGGLLFDLLVVPALLTRRFRILACGFAIAFHLTNAWLFTIGVFPWFMLFALPIYFPAGSIRRLIGYPAVDTAGLSPESVPATWRLRLGITFLLMFVFVQVMLPLRHFAIPGNVNWTEEGHCFSWHMLVRGKRCALRLTASHPETGKTGTIDLRPYLSELQLSRVAREPRLIHELVRYVEHDLRVKGIENVQIRALALASMNGRKPQHLVDPTVDLTHAPLGFLPPPWIVPLHEPLRKQAWDVPIQEWEDAVSSR